MDTEKHTLRLKSEKNELKTQKHMLGRRKANQRLEEIITYQI